MADLVTVEAAETRVKEISPRALAMVQEAQEFTIVVPEHYTYGGTRLLTLKEEKNQVEEKRKSLTGPLDEVKKRIMDLFRPILGAYEEAETIYKGKLVEYHREQEEARRLQEARLREDTRKEQERIRTQAEKEAKRAETKRDPERAEEIRNAVPELPMPVVVKPDVPKIRGIYGRDNWKFRIVDAEKIPPIYLMPDEQAIGKVVRALKDKTDIPGVEVWNEGGIAAGAR